jgi:hypothetical protein
LPVWRGADWTEHLVCFWPGRRGAGGGSPAVTKLGDIWQIGPHRLICGDATTLETYARLLDVEKAQLVFTDPPYNVRIDGHVSGLGKVKHREFAFASGEMSEAECTGFSSHHAKAIEVYRGKLVLYGCGDLINDYEGFRGDLVMMYLAHIRSPDGALAALEMLPFRIRAFRLERAHPRDAAWLAETLSREGSRFGTRVELAPDGALRLSWTREEARSVPLEQK